MIKVFRSELICCPVPGDVLHGGYGSQFQVIRVYPDYILVAKVEKSGRKNVGQIFWNPSLRKENAQSLP